MKSSKKVGESWKNSAAKLFIESPVSHLTSWIFLIYLGQGYTYILIDELDLLNLS